MAAAGFDPNALLNYLARVLPKYTKGAEELSPLPPLPVRIRNLTQAIRRLPVPSPLHQTSRSMPSKTRFAESKC